MCHLSPQDQHVCQSNHRIAEALTGVLGGAQFPAGSFYYPRSSRSRFRPTRKEAICAGNFPDSNGIRDDCKRQNRSHQTEPVPIISYLVFLLFINTFDIRLRPPILTGMTMLIFCVAWVITFLILMFAYKLVYKDLLTRPWKMTRPRGVHIFISYRREDTGGYAGRIFDRLSQLLGRERVFMDIDTIEPGIDFADTIQQAVSACDILLVLI